MVISAVLHVGDAKDIQEAVTGKDLITGKKLTGGDRALTITAAVLPVVSGPMLKGAAKGGKIAVKEAPGAIKKAGTLIKKNAPELKKAVKNSDVAKDTAKVLKEKVGDISYDRPSGFRKGVRDKVWENAKNSDGNVIDPLTGNVMDKSEPWDMGHKPGFEFRKHQKSAEGRRITRKQFLDEHNKLDHYRPELPSSNRSHKGEDLTNDYLGD